jgi:hypothetical protein
LNVVVAGRVSTAAGMLGAGCGVDGVVCCAPAGVDDVDEPAGCCPFPVVELWAAADMALASAMSITIATRFTIRTRLP